MTITILDADTLGNDINLEQIEQFGTLTKYGTTPPDYTAKRIKDSDIIITNKVVIGQNELKTADKLKLICVAATGYNNIDISAACEHNVTVCNVKGYSTESVAQTVFGYLLQFACSTTSFADYTAKGHWQKSQLFTSLKFPVFELKGKTLGLFGYGTIGKRVAEIAKVFGMKILIAQSQINTADQKGRVSKEKVLTKSDFISIHTPLSPETENMISAAELELMKPTAFLINTARGGIVNENDLRQALENSTIAGAGFDVLSKEPPTEGNPLTDAPNMLLTPHVAWTSKESRERLIKGIVHNIESFLKGKSDEINLCTP